MPSLQHVYDDWVVLPMGCSPSNVSRHCGSEQQHLHSEQRAWNCTVLLQFLLWLAKCWL